MDKKTYLHHNTPFATIVNMGSLAGCKIYVELTGTEEDKEAQYLRTTSLLMSAMNAKAQTARQNEQLNRLVDSAIIFGQEIEKYKAKKNEAKTP